jgi:ATP synthase protein I
MPKLVLPAIRREIVRCILFPAIAVVLISLILLIFKRHEASYSVFLGGIVWVIPNGLIANWLFSNVSARAVRQIVFKFYIAEAIKLVLTAVLFIAIIKILPLSIGYFLLGFFVAQVCFWITAGFYIK